MALNKKSAVHYLLLQALDKEGVEYEDIQPPQAVFVKKRIDAWVIWDPYYAPAK